MPFFICSVMNDRTALSTMLRFLSGEAGGTVQGGGGSPECLAWEPAVWMWGRLAERPGRGPAVVSPQLCSLGLAVTFWEPCQDGHWSPASPPPAHRLWRPPAPASAVTPHCTPTSLATDRLALSCTLGVSLRLARSLCAISGLAKQETSAMPWAEPCLLHWGLNLAVRLSMGTWGTRQLPILTVTLWS